jgi:hypothetical protein
VTLFSVLTSAPLDVNLEDDDDILAESGNQLGTDTEQSTLLDDLWLVEDDDAATEG